MAEKKVDAFDFDGIRLLVELMKENNVSELDLEQNGSRLVLRRSGCAQPAEIVSTVQSVFPAHPTAPAPTPAPAAAPATKKENPNLKTIVSPMVGTFYASSSPTAKPFVSVGDVVAPDTTVCIIEAMKIFNDIPAEISGKIVEVLVKNGDPVEYGAPLFKVEAQ